MQEFGCCDNMWDPVEFSPRSGEAVKTGSQPSQSAAPSWPLPGAKLVPDPMYKIEETTALVHRQRDYAWEIYQCLIRCCLACLTRPVCLEPVWYARSHGNPPVFQTGVKRQRRDNIVAAV